MVSEGSEVPRPLLILLSIAPEPLPVSDTEEPAPAASPNQANPVQTAAAAFGIALLA